MVYADFELEKAVQSFGLSLDGSTDLFRDVGPIKPSEFLRGFLKDFTPVALGINTDQARRDFLITPILVEAKRRSEVDSTVLPGIPLTVDPARGLTGICDYLIARSRKLYYLEAPVVAVVEAEREDLIARLGECVAQMVAMQLFNEKDGTPLPAVYGCVASGTTWRFLERIFRSTARSITWVMSPRSWESWSASYGVTTHGSRVDRQWFRASDQRNLGSVSWKRSKPRT
jgi:hypothetical protein